MERALMEGGHEVPARKQEQYSFINGLGEARMFKTRNQISKEGVRSISDHLFVGLLSLYAMSNDYNYAPVASAYARQTAQRGNFNNPSPSGTDMYQTVHTLLKPEGLVNSEADKMLLGKIRVDQQRIKTFMKQVERGNVSPGQAQSFFYKLEKDLAIQDPKLRATRRLVQGWNELSTQQQTLAATHIDRYYRQSARRSDMNPIFNTFAKENNLIAGGSKMAKIGKRVARGAAAFAAGYVAGKMTEM